MSASATDKFQKVSIATATTLDAPGYTIGDTTITVASTSTWPTDTGVTFAIDEVDANGVRVAGSYNEYVGTVASGTSVTNVSHVNGTNRNYTAGTTTRVYIPVSEERENRLVDGIRESLAQDGTIDAQSVANFQDHIDVVDGKAIRDGNDNELIKFSQTASAVNEVSVKNAATGSGPELQATGGDTNIDLNLTPKGTGKVKIGGNPIEAGAWTAYTPTTTGWSGTPTTTDTAYTQIGKAVIYKFFVSGTSNSTSVIVSLPVNAKAGTYSYEGTLGLAQDNGTIQTTAHRVAIDPTASVTQLRCYHDMATANWTGSGAKAVRGTIIYEAA